MAAMEANTKLLMALGVGVAALAIVTVTAIAVLIGFKDTQLVDNTITDTFIAGLGIIATFIGVVILAMIGKIIMKIVTEE